MMIQLTQDEIKEIIKALPDSNSLSNRLKKKMSPTKGPKADLSFLANKWPSDIVYRKDIPAFTGGVFSAATMANFDSQGKGPQGRIRVNKKQAYRIQPLIRWMEDMSEVLS